MAIGTAEPHSKELSTSALWDALYCMKREVRRLHEHALEYDKEILAPLLDQFEKTVLRFGTDLYPGVGG